MGTLVDRLGITLRLTWAVLRHPFSIVYPMFTATIYPLLFVGFGYLYVSMATSYGPSLPNGLLAWIIALVGGLVVYFVVGTTLIGVFQVGYCYEIDRLYRGRRPLPGAGFVAILVRLPKILVVMSILNAAYLLSYFSMMFGASHIPLDRLFSRLGIKLVDVDPMPSSPEMRWVFLMLFPALAVENETLSETVDGFLGAANGQANAARVRTFGMNRLNGIPFFAGLLAGPAIPAAYLSGHLPFEPNFAFIPVAPGIPQTIFLTIATILFGLWASTFPVVFYRSPVNVALYHYATEGGVPDTLGVEIDDLVDGDMTTKQN